MTTASRDRHAEYLISLWHRIAQQAEDAAPLHQGLWPHPEVTPEVTPEALATALPLAATRWLASHADPSSRPLALRVMATFGNALQQGDLGHGAAQIELAIATYNWVLSELSSATSPIDWATTLNNLATAYRHRPMGNPADNLEQAIKLYQQALAVPSPTTRPVSLTGLAAAYRDRIYGDPSDNLDRAIATYEQALSAISPHALPAAWAMVNQHLAAAYGDRQRGDRQHNVEAAIQTYQQTYQRT
ncbi:MAG: hypothetical protein DCF32_12245 [Leptolyngbya sp.]|nr:MAG: hypothetical protein DCF32_12245 [Leptolyngbya sp.]